MGSTEGIRKCIGRKYIRSHRKYQRVILIFFLKFGSRYAYIVESLTPCALHVFHISFCICLIVNKTIISKDYGQYKKLHEFQTVSLFKNRLCLQVYLH